MPRGKLTTKARLRQQVTRLKNINAKQKVKIVGLEQQLNQKDKIIETLQLRIEDLERMVFGEKRSDDEDHSTRIETKSAKKPKKRPNSSYRRKKPKPSEITKSVTYPIDQCPDCALELIDKKIHIRYQEDIALRALTPEPQKTVEKQQIESGYCQHCKRRYHAKLIPPQLVTIGPQTRVLIIYASYVSRLSFSQIKDWLRAMYRLEVSSGEIANILQASANKLQPKYQALLAKIRKSSVINIDETSHLENGQKKWAWVVTQANSELTVYQIGYRGKGEALELLGEDFNGVLVHDDYGAYRNLGNNHQLCWAHLIRKARDVAEAKALSDHTKRVCGRLYERIQSLHYSLPQSTASDLPELEHQLDLILRRDKYYPDKIVKLQNEMRRNRDRLFTCVTHDGVPTTNNQAERKLRPLVLKRKNSYGTRSEKGSRTFAINASVVLSTWWQHKHQALPRLYRMLND